MEEPGRENRNHDKHTFHLPNIFSRATRSNNSDYDVIPTGEEQVGEVDAGSESEQATLTGVGVETSPEWHTMTAAQQSMVRIAFGIFGATVLLPFNALITPSEYYRSLVAGTARETSFMSWIIAIYCVSSILFGAHATTSMQRASVGKRIIWSAALIISALLVTTVFISLVERPASAGSSNTAFFLVLALSLVLSAGTAYLQIAVVTLANAYGPSCMGTMLAGQGVVGASVSLVQLITAFSASTQSTIGTLREEGESRKAALRFFGTNTAFVMVGLCTFLVLQRTFLYSDMKTRMEDVKVSLAAVLEQDTVRAEQGEDHYRSVTGVKRYMSSQTQQRFSRVSSVQKKVVLACLSIAYIFTITLAVFPALTARVQSTDTDKSLPIIIFVALHFFVFNLGDLVGRVLPSAAPRLFLLRKMRVIACLCLLRTAFIPLLTFCNVSSTSSPHSTPSFVFSDSIFFSLMALLGLSNGILATSIFVIGPRQDDLTDSSEQGLAVGLLSWWLTFGLALGSLSSFVVAANL